MTKHPFYPGRVAAGGAKNSRRLLSKPPCPWKPQTGSVTRDDPGGADAHRTRVYGRSSHFGSTWTGWLVTTTPIPHIPPEPPTGLPGGHGRKPSTSPTKTHVDWLGKLPGPLQQPREGKQLVRWSAVLLVHWSTGPLVHWSTGSTGPLVYWSTGPLVQRSTGLLVYWSNGLMVYWSTGLLV